MRVRCEHEWNVSCFVHVLCPYATRCSTASGRKCSSVCCMAAHVWDLDCGYNRIAGNCSGEYARDHASGRWSQTCEKSGADYATTNVGKYPSLNGKEKGLRWRCCRCHVARAGISLDFSSSRDPPSRDYTVFVVQTSYVMSVLTSLRC